MMYITMPLQVMKIHHKLEQALRVLGKYDRTHHTHTLYTGAEYGEIMVKPHYIRMNTSGNVSMETTFFEVLRKCELTFLAMDYENTKYGWLNPLKQVRSICVKCRIVSCLIEKVLVHCKVDNMKEENICQFG